MTRPHVAIVLIVMACLLCASTLASSRKFYDDDPIAREPDSQDAAKVAEWDIELLVDLATNLFATPGRNEPSTRAGNVNTIDEVPDSNWFTNRIATQPLSVQQVVRGPLTGGAPAPGPWTVIAPKTAGAAPGFTMRDTDGTLWFVSFDSAGQPEAATAAILVANRIFWALGYYQVENRLITVRRDRLIIGSSASVTPMSGKKRAMKDADLDEIFIRANRSPDGSYRAVAARGLPGRVVGGFRYHGTRPDDPNDVVPHQERRELRALKVFGAWTNLVDMKAGNTLDTVVTENGRSVVRHYLQDVGSTFGTGANGLREYDEGWEYLVELDKVRERFFKMGLPLMPWHHAEYADNFAVGRFEGDAFDPPAWKPRVPTGAFLKARADDNFWAARRVGAFTDEMIRALATTGQYSHPEDAELLASVLIKRRDKITRAYFNAINPLVDFALSPDGRLTFRNAAVDAGVGAAPADGYRATWSRFDNASGSTTAIGSPSIATAAETAAPAALPQEDGAYLKIAVAALGNAPEPWTRPVEVYFRKSGSAWRLVGIDRQP